MSYKYSSCDVDNALVSQQLVLDALELLKALDTVKPILKRKGHNIYYNYYVCPICKEDIVYGQNYCSECGRAMEWDE